MRTKFNDSQCSRIHRELANFGYPNVKIAEVRIALDKYTRGESPVGVIEIFVHSIAKDFEEVRREAGR